MPLTFNSVGGIDVDNAVVGILTGIVPSVTKGTNTTVVDVAGVLRAGTLTLVRGKCITPE